MIEFYENPSYPEQPVTTYPVQRNGIEAIKINGLTEITNGTIFAEKLVVGVQSWTHNLTWTATDADTASWSSGSIQFADGSVISIDSGNTGTIAATTYIYYDGTSTLKTSTNKADAVSSTNVLLAIVELADTGTNCVITAFNAIGTTIDGDRITTGIIQAPDGGTQFNLVSDYIKMADDVTNRLLLGRVP